jgi:hypothetical protein
MLVAQGVDDRDDPLSLAGPDDYATLVSVSQGSSNV